MKTPLQTVREAVIAAVPEIMELKCGCKFSWDARTESFAGEYIVTAIDMPTIMAIKVIESRDIEDGYKVKVFTENWEKIILQPLFWQALGKAEGWTKLAPYELVNRNIPEWQYNWHKFIDHLAEGKDADSFFEQLLIKTK